MPQTPGMGNSAPGRGFGWDGDAERGWGPQPHLAGAEQGSSEGSTASLARPARGLRQGQEVARSPRASGRVFYSVVGGIFQRWLLGPVPLQLQLYSPFQRQRRQTVSTPLPFRACQKRGDRHLPGTPGGLRPRGRRWQSPLCPAASRGIKQQLVYF